MTATSYAPMHFVAPPPPHPSSSFAPDSDCGSSSGVGGSGVLKHDDASSLDSDSRDSSAPPPPQVVPVPPIPTNIMHHNPMTMPPPTAFTSPPPTMFIQRPFTGHRPPMMPPRPFYTMTYNSYDQNGCNTGPSATSTSGPNGANATPNGPALIATGPGAPGIVTNGSAAPLPMLPPMTSGSSVNDIYVHVQPGETITLLAANNDDKHIQGPATIRMIGQNNATPMALPLRVPIGHLVQQILDEQGRLKHVILSPQQNGQNAPGVSPRPPTAPISKQHNAVPSTSNDLGPSPKSLSPPGAVPPYPPQALMGADLLMSAPPDMSTIPAGMVYPNPLGRGPWVNGTTMKRPSPTMPMGAGVAGQHVDYGMYHGQAYMPQQVPPFVNHAGVMPSSDLAEDRYELFEDDERERLQETLDLIQPPTLLNVKSRHVELTWQELDTSEAAASGGPFPQIDASEFTYEIFLYDSVSRRSTQLRCDYMPGVQNMMRIPRLRPNADYSVTIRASLPERNIFGNQSTPLNFRTLPVLPDTPNAPKIGMRTPTMLNVSWRYNANVAVTAFLVQFAKTKHDTYVLAYEGGGDFCRISHLEPGTAYKVRIIVRSEYGDSEPSPPSFAQTTSEAPPAPVINNVNTRGTTQQQSLAANFKIAPPQVVACYNRSIKVSWTPVFDTNSYTLEYSEGRLNDFRAVNNDAYSNNGTSALVSGLTSNREYVFRLHVMTDTGAQLRSDSITTRTRREQYENSSYTQSNNAHHDSNVASASSQGRDRLQAPTQLATTSVDACTIEVTWRYPGREFDTLGFVLDGSSATSPGDWRTCYRGTAMRAVINDPMLSAFRVQATNLKKHTTGPWSDAYYVKRKSTPVVTPSEEIVPVLNVAPQHAAPVPAVTTPVAASRPTCSIPKVYNVTWSSMEVQWQLEGPLSDIDAAATLQYELERVDAQSMIVYSGDQTQTIIDGLKPAEHVQLRARAIVTDSNHRVEGEWSQVVSAQTTCAAPSVPQNLRIAMDNGAKASLVWDAPAESNGAEILHYIVRTVHVEAEDDAAALNQTTKTEFLFSGLLPSNTYNFTVSAVNNGGESSVSEALQFETPATEPEAPQELHVEALSSCELSLAWMPGSDNGAPITTYKLTVHELSTDSRSASKHLVAQHQLAGDTIAFVAGKLNSLTLYELEIVAENAKGTSEAATIRCETFAVPPDAPLLNLSQAYSNMLKLKWTPVANTAYPEPSYFYLEKENDFGSFSLVFEGEARSTKVKGLRDASTYRFRVRSAHARGIPSLMGKWSQVYEFTTTASPPLAPRSAPTVIEVATSMFQFEWPTVKAVGSVATNSNPSNSTGESENEQQPSSSAPVVPSSSSSIFYRLQIAPKGDRRAAFEPWKTAYEGSCPSCTLNLPSTTMTRMARVFAIQKTANGEELCSLPSLIAQFSSTLAVTDSPRKRLNKAAPSATVSSGERSNANNSEDDSTPNHKTTLALYRSSRMSTYKRCKRFFTQLRRSVSERNNALATMMAFFVIALTIALLLNNLYL